MVIISVVVKLRSETREILRISDCLIVSAKYAILFYPITAVLTL